MAPLETSVGAAAVLSPPGDPGRVILTLRAATKRSYPGVWELPGGALEAEESAEDAVRREIREELGVEIEGLEPLGTDLSHHDGRRHLVFLFRGTCDPDALRPDPREIAGWRLVGADFHEPGLFPRVAEELELYRRRLGLSPGGFAAKAAGWDLNTLRHDRARAVATAIDAHLPPRVDRGLDFGCGTGLLGMEWADRVGRMDFCDPEPAMRAQVEAKLAHRPGWGTTLDPSQLVGPYDLVASLMVLHHIPSTREVLARLAGLLAPGGTLALADLDREDGSFHPDETVPHRGFDRLVLQRILEGQGLTMVSSTTPYVIPKAVGGRDRLFPVFLLVARRVTGPAVPPPTA